MATMLMLPPRAAKPCDLYRFNLTNNPQYATWYMGRWDKDAFNLLTFLISIHSIFSCLTPEDIFCIGYYILYQMHVFHKIIF